MVMSMVKIAGEMVMLMVKIAVILRFGTRVLWRATLIHWFI